MKCPACQTENPDDKKYCRECGADLVLNCPKCGAEVFAVDKIEATITGVGGIIYAGNPDIIERQITGFGKIIRADEYIEIENS